MEISEADDSTTPANRRKSGRNVRRPDLYSEDNFAGSLLESSSVKRKRTALNDITNRDASDEEPESEGDAESEGDPDEEELREQRRVSKQKKKPSPAPKKKQKVALNGSEAHLPMRPAANTGKKVATKARTRAKKPRVRPSQAGDANSLYGKITQFKKRCRLTNNL